MPLLDSTPMPGENKEKSSRIDSKVIIDMPGTERLIGHGDLLLSQGVEVERLQGGFISKEEVDAIVDSIVSQKSFNTPYYLPTPVDAEKG